MTEMMVWCLENSVFFLDEKGAKFMPSEANGNLTVKVYCFNRIISLHVTETQLSALRKKGKLLVHVTGTSVELVASGMAGSRSSMLTSFSGGFLLVLAR